MAQLVLMLTHTFSDNLRALCTERGLMLAPRSICAITLCTLAACASDSDRFSSGVFVATHKVSVETELYVDGPQQGRPPDGTVRAGKLVHRIATAGSYTHIQLQNNQRGWIASDALEPLASR